MRQYQHRLGDPHMENMNRIPKTPIVSITRPDGERLIELCKAGALGLDPDKALCGLGPMSASCGRDKGSREPEKVMLVHGHYDAWHYGVGENSTGNAVCLEIARVLNPFKNRLFRSVKIAWWPGHSTGRYGGSTWYADQFALDLAENCIAQINIDSPGCRWADEYDGVMWMSEVRDFCEKVIRDVTGKRTRGIRP